MACLLAMCTSTQAQEGQGGGQGRGGGMGMGMGMGNPIRGAVTAIGASDLSVKTEEGDVYTVQFSTNTRFIKDRQPVKATEVKVGDYVIAMGEVDAKAKTIGAVMVAELSPDQIKQMKDMQASYGKTWLRGKITAIDETRVSITGMDGKPATIMLDENTSLKKRRDSITLADVKVGDIVIARGAIKEGSFVATDFNVMVPPAPGERPQRGPGGMGGPGGANGQGMQPPPPPPAAPNN